MTQPLTPDQLAELRRLKPESIGEGRLSFCTAYFTGDGYPKHTAKYMAAVLNAAHALLDAAEENAKLRDLLFAVQDECISKTLDAEQLAAENAKLRFAAQELVDCVEGCSWREEDAAIDAVRKLLEPKP